MKTCKKCGIDKEIVDYYEGKNICKECTKSNSKKYRKDNKKKILKREAEYRNSHKEYYENYRKENKEYFKNKQKKYKILGKYYIITPIDTDNKFKTVEELISYIEKSIGNCSF